MFTKEQTQKAIREIDENIAMLNGTRQAHLALVQDVQIVQEVCMRYFDGLESKKETKDVRADKPIDPASVINKDK